MSIVVGMDPGLATFGMTAVETDGSRHELVGSHFFASEKGDGNVTDDMRRRAAELSVFLDRVLRIYPGAAAYAAESVSYPRSAKAVAFISAAWGVMTSVMERMRIHQRLVHAGPSTVRVAVAGPRKAATATRPAETKEEFEARARAVAVGRVHGARERLMQTRVVGIPHILDALVVTVWSFDHRFVRGAVLA